MERLTVTDRPEHEVRTLEAMLARDLSGWPSDCWLVIDDYHEASRSVATETLTEHLLADAPLNALILSRRRPRWASSRRILYGEIFEIDRTVLAMSDTEAATMLGTDRPTALDLINAARGWPAVLALAAVTETRPSGLVAEPQLYGFFAEEIFGRLDRRTRQTLTKISLFGREGRRVALTKLGSDEAHRAIAQGLACGFLTEQSGAEIALHPLATEFLRLKLRQEHAHQLREVVSDAVAILLENSLWDEAHSLIDAFQREDLLPHLVARAVDDLLTSGRSATLRSWIGDSTTIHPALLLASAELAFREGRFYEAEALAAHAATDLSADANASARAAFVAGRAAHVGSREAQARGYFETAQSLATDDTLKWRAALGALVAAIELEDQGVEDLLRSLTRGRPLEPADEVAIADRHLAYETRFCRPVDLQRGRSASQLLRFVRDPVARASFRNIFGYALASMAYWDEATILTDEQLQDAERCRLDFVVPYALLVRAMVAIGRREYEDGSAKLSVAEEHARGTGDLAALQMVTALRGRALIAQGLFEEAVRQSDVDLSRITRSVNGELLGVKALAAAASGHIQSSRSLAGQSLDASLGVETVINAHCALAVAALTERDHVTALDHAAIALEHSVTTGMIESLVCAYRGCPQLIVCLLARRELHDSLTLVLHRAGDSPLADSAGLQPGDSSVLSLSPREKEVLALLAQGHSNAVIGKSLYISPVTVKVHVRHIFDKLGVRSRAEAALRASQLNRGSSHDDGA